jgi:hypothetical protein
VFPTREFREAMPGMPDRENLATFSKAYDLQNHLTDDQAVSFLNAMHPIYGICSIGYGFPEDIELPARQVNRRQRPGIHLAADPKTGQTRMRETGKVHEPGAIERSCS